MLQMKLFKHNLIFYSFYFNKQVVILILLFQFKIVMINLDSLYENKKALENLVK
jgi:hypothetical protein